MLDHEIKVPGPQAKTYKVRIGTEILGSLWLDIQTAFAQYKPFVITDANLVSAGHLRTLLAERNIPTFVINPPGETSKNISTIIAIIEKMEKAYLGRDTVVLALGGGTVGDMAGFAASIFKRGVPVVHIPTTTVAQADSAIGGKTGVDSSVSKNAFGTFWHPAAVYIDVMTLKSLDERHFRAGLVESVKHALIADNQYFEFLESNLDGILQRSPELLESIAYQNCRIKGGVVEEDPDEKNKRRILNYGHTIGHAVESVSGFGLLHGEAVAIGIIAAGLIEMEMQIAQPDKLNRIRKILEKIGVPVKLPASLAEDKLLDVIQHDKKAVGKWPRFVLISEIGRVYCQNGQWAVPVSREIIIKVLKEIRTE
jgi:3-dehydroquinate synthase